MVYEEIGEKLEALKKDQRLPPETCPLLLFIHEELAQFFPFRAGADFLRNARALLVDLQTRMSKKEFAWGDEDKCIFLLIFENLKGALEAEKRLSNQVGPFYDAVALMMDQKNANLPPRYNTTNEDVLTQPPVKLPDEPGPAVADDHNMLTRLMHIAMLCANGDRFLLFLRNAPIDDREAPEDFRYFLGACMDRFFPVDSPAEVNEDTARWLLNLTKKFECVETVAKFLTSHMGALQKELAALPCDQLRRVIKAMTLTATQRTHLLLHHIITQRRACVVRRCAKAPLAAEDDEPGPADEPEDGRAPPEPQEDGPEEQPCCSLWPLVDLRLLDMGHWQQIADHHVSLPVHVATFCLPQFIKSQCATEQQLLLSREELFSAVQRMNDMQEQLLNAERVAVELQEQVTQSKEQIERNQEKFLQGQEILSIMQERVTAAEKELNEVKVANLALRSQIEKADISRRGMELQFTEFLRCGGKIPTTEQLLTAAQTGKIEIVRIFMIMGGDVNVADERGNTALHWASQKRQTEIVEALIAAGANLSAQNVDKNTPLHFAVGCQALDALKALIHAGAHLELKDKNGQTPLNCAAYYASPSCAQELIAAGADVNSKDNNENSPLQWATYKKSVSLVEMLIAAGADVNSTEKAKWTPLHHAAHVGADTALLQMLVNAGADVNAVNSSGNRPWQSAQRRGHKEATELLKKQAAE